jgi:tetratricopeptide (TPR) repeat protein
MSQKLSRTRFSVLLLAALVSLLTISGCQYAATGHNIEGKKLYGEGQYGLALQRFQQAIAANPNDADAYYNMGAAYHQLGRQMRNQAYLSQAESLYLQALQRNPNHVDSYRGRTVLMAETGRNQQAFEMLKGWVVQNQQSSEARVELARFYQEQGDAQTAKVQLEQAVQLDPNNTQALNYLGYLREQSGDYTQAMQNYQRSLGLNGTQPEISSRVAQLQQSVGGFAAPPAGPATRTVNSGFSFPVR